MCILKGYQWLRGVGDWISGPWRSVHEGLGFRVRHVSTRVDVLVRLAPVTVKEAKEANLNIKVVP